MILPIVKYPDERLRQETCLVSDFNADIKKLVSDLIDTMYSENGAGIAAIQVGRPEKIFVIDDRISNTKNPVVFINPIISKSTINEDSIIETEGCLSFPNLFVDVKRYKTIFITAQDIVGEIFSIEATSLYAKAIQHEFDHLNGKLLIDYIPKFKQKIIKNKLLR